MGKRLRGVPKKKSIKAALASSMIGSKRKLTRFGKNRKKHKAGTAAAFIGRSKCLKKLQVTIKDFRRLCILKGIYPRLPVSGKVPGKSKNQTFYHIKDIKAIAHEPLLQKFREFKAFMKKVRRAAGRNELDEAKRKNALLPTYTLEHLVKERYPRFVDALSDLDDALTLSYLFAALPTDRDISSKVINQAKALVAAWGAYCATTSSITKAFISVRGVYLEVVICGQPIRWIVPHSFTQFMPEETVDYRVMMTFFEFYETLLSFVMFKLYHDIGVRYPFPMKELGRESLGSTAAVLGANLRALSNALKSSDDAVRNAVSAMVEEGKKEQSTAENNESGEKEDSKESSEKKTEQPKEAAVAMDVTGLPELPEDDKDDDADGEKSDDDESVDVAGPLKAALESVSEQEARSMGTGKDLDEEGLKRKRLFSGLTFFLSREVPRGYLELVGLAFGAKVGWEGPDSPISMSDPSITHHIVDRPKLLASYSDLPQSREFVQPQWILDCTNHLLLLPIAKYQVGAELPPHLSPWVDNDEVGYTPAYAEEIERLKNGESVAADSDVEEMMVEASKEEKEVDGESDGEKMYEKGEQDAEESAAGKKQESSDEEEEEEEEDEETERRRKEKDLKEQKKEEHVLAKSMMNRKAKFLYNRMQYGLQGKRAKAEALQQRRKEIEASKEKKDGKSLLKQKVERLKNERKSVEKAYSNTGGSMKKKKQGPNTK